MSNSNIEDLSDAGIARALAPFGVQPDAASCAAIRAYTEMLLRWNEKISLTSIRRPEEILQRHFGESMFAARTVPIVRGRLVDVGSGAGFPGLAMKLVSPELEVTLIESSVKKSAFLAEVVRALGLSGVKIISKRIEELDEFRAVADFVTCRAVKADKDLLEWARRALYGDGLCALWVGAEDAEDLGMQPGWQWREPISIPLSDRRVILVRQPIGK